jgi:hypothetical protein
MCLAMDRTLQATTTTRLLLRVRQTTAEREAASLAGRPTARGARHLVDGAAVRAAARRCGIAAVAVQVAAASYATTVESPRVVGARARRKFAASPRPTAARQDGAAVRAAVPAPRAASQSASTARSASARTGPCQRRRRARRAGASTRRRGQRRGRRRTRSTATPSRLAPKSRAATATNSTPLQAIAHRLRLFSSYPCLAVRR